MRKGRLRLKDAARSTSGSTLGLFAACLHVPHLHTNTPTTLRVSPQNDCFPANLRWIRFNYQQWNRFILIPSHFWADSWMFVTLNWISWSFFIPKCDHNFLWIFGPFQSHRWILPDNVGKMWMTGKEKRKMSEEWTDDRRQELETSPAAVSRTGSAGSGVAAADDGLVSGKWTEGWKERGKRGKVHLMIIPWAHSWKPWQPESLPRNICAGLSIIIWIRNQIHTNVPLISRKIDIKGQTCDSVINIEGK